MWAKWLYHSYCVGAPQHSAQGHKSEMAKWSTCMQSGSSTPAVLGVPNAQHGDSKSEMAMWSTCGQSGYIIAIVLGVHNAQQGDKDQKWLRGPHAGKVATSHLPSRGSPMLSAGGGGD